MTRVGTTDAKQFEHSVSPAILKIGSASQASNHQDPPQRRTSKQSNGVHGNVIIPSRQTGDDGSRPDFGALRLVKPADTLARNMNINASTLNDEAKAANEEPGQYFRKNLQAMNLKAFALNGPSGTAIAPVAGMVLMSPRTLFDLAFLGAP